MSKGREVILPGDRYVFEDSVVGEGAQGKVHLGYDLTNNDRIAIKFVNKHALKEKNLQRLDTEVKILTEIKHKNIVSFKCFYSDYVLPLDCGGNGFPWGVIVMENCPYDLFDYLLSLGSFSEDVSRTYFNQLIDGLNACHKKGVYHRDIKPENLLLDSNFQLKIADFGLASMSEEYASSSTSIGTKSSLLRSYCGSNAYMAPEVFAGQAYEGKFADLWSSAVVLFVMVSGFQPFQVPAPNDWWMNKIINFRYARFWEAHVRSGPHLARYSQFRDLINNMFVYDANNRYDLNQIRQHIWMNGKVLHPEELEDIMAYQEEVVRKAKRIDRERKNAERVKKMNAKSTAATANGTFNAFARDKVHRDIACSVPTRNELLTKHDIIVSSGTESLHGDFIMFEKILKQIDDKCVYSVDPRNYTFTIDEIMLPGLMLSATDTEDMEQLPGLQLQNIECHMYLYKCEDIALTMMTFVSCVPEDLNYMHATHVQANPSVNATATVFSNIPDTMTKKAQTPMSMLQIKPLITLLRKYFDELDASDNDITTSTAPYLKDNNNAMDGMDTEEEDGEDVMGMI